MNARTHALATRFMGEHIMKLDPKGRVSIPSDFINPIDSDLIFYKAPHSPVIVAYGVSDIVSEEAQALLCAFSKAVTPDGSKRVVLPHDLREHIGLEEHRSSSVDLAVVGTGRNFHIMTTDCWLEMKPVYEKRLDELLAQADVLWTP